MEIREWTQPVIKEENDRMFESLKEESGDDRSNEGFSAAAKQF